MRISVQGCWCILALMSLPLPLPNTAAEPLIVCIIHHNAFWWLNCIMDISWPQCRAEDCFWQSSFTQNAFKKKKIKTRRHTIKNPTTPMRYWDNSRSGWCLNQHNTICWIVSCQENQSWFSLWALAVLIFSHIRVSFCKNQLSCTETLTEQKSYLQPHCPAESVPLWRTPVTLFAKGVGGWTKTEDGRRGK